ncbi:dead ringer-like protein-2 [Penaeus vannamei]|uniref:Dead ringer-like protein-2 n=1 Tax=Penaeus vannamei TaxID=6689 RepID=A0A3R7M9R3_PENVA|nr:dead ringer-like protein-2 [Penaeus vannamei]
MLAGRRGGSPPGSQEALLEATRLTMWKLYNQGLGGGFQHEEDGPKLPPPPHPLAGIPFPPQKEALNLDVKEDRSFPPSPLSLLLSPGLPLGERESDRLATPRQEKTAELRPPMGVGLGGMLTPTAKRPMHHEEPLETRPPMPASPTHHQPLTPSLPSIKISSRGNGRSQDQSIVVSMEINGILHPGRDLANPFPNQRRIGLDCCSAGERILKARGVNRSPQEFPGRRRPLVMTRPCLLFVLLYPDERSTCGCASIPTITLP